MPAAVERLLTADVAGEIARTFGDQPVYPQRILVDDPVEPSRGARFVTQIPGLAGTGPGAVR